MLDNVHVNAAGVVDFEKILGQEGVYVSNYLVRSGEEQETLEDEAKLQEQ